MAVATPTEVRQVGIAHETVRGTLAAAPTKFLSLTKDSNIDFTSKVLPDPALRGYNAHFAGFAGAQEGKGPFKTPLRASDVGYFLHMLLGAPTSSVEQASFVVTLNVNDTLDMTEDGGAEIHITLTPGSYLAGQTSADAGTLCALLKTVIEAGNGASTYTVTYSRTTNKFTITKNTGVFIIKFLTGVNTAKNCAALLGFTVADTASAIAAVSDSTIAAAFKHTFVQGQTTQLPSYSIFINRGLAANPYKSYNMGSVSKLKISGKDDAPVEMEASLLAQLEAVFSGTFTPVYSESPALMFSQTVIKVAGAESTVPNVADWSVDMDPGLKAYRPLSAQKYPYDFLAAGPFAGGGDMTVYFMTEAERDKFVARTATTLQFTITGSVVAGGTVKHTLDLYFPVVEYESYPLGDQGGFLGAKVKWGAKGSIAAGAFVPAVTAFVINAVPAYT